MALRAELRENISQTKYLSAEHYLQHLSIMRLFFLEHQKNALPAGQKHHFSHLCTETVFSQYTSEKLNEDLDQRW